MSTKHTSVRCGRLQGRQAGQVCERCSDQCVGCEADRHLREEARVCDACAAQLLTSLPLRRGVAAVCIQCGGKGAVQTAYFCRECVLLMRDRDGCPRVLTVGGAAAAGHLSGRGGR